MTEQRDEADPGQAPEETTDPIVEPTEGSPEFIEEAPEEPIEASEEGVAVAPEEPEAAATEVFEPIPAPTIPEPVEGSPDAVVDPVPDAAGVVESAPEETAFEAVPEEAVAVESVSDEVNVVESVPDEAAVVAPLTSEATVVEPVPGPTILESAGGSPEPDEEASNEPVPDEPTVVHPIPTEPIPAQTEGMPTEPTLAALRPRPEPTQAIFRDSPPEPEPEPDAEPTRLDPLGIEEQRLAAERAARKEARDAALAASAPVPLVAPIPEVVVKRSTDGFFGSLGLFLLRLVVAAIFAVRGLNLLTNLAGTQALFAQTVIPEPAIMSIVTGVACLLIALALVLGLLTRIAGLGVALIAGGSLAFVQWGAGWSPLLPAQPGQPGFLGEVELLLAAVGILLLCVGGGGWGLDRSFRASRAKDKAAKAAAA